MFEDKHKVALIIGGIAITAIAFVVVPPIINTISRKLYRAQSSTKDIDFDNLGPEIVKKSDTNEGEE